MVLSSGGSSPRCLTSANPGRAGSAVAGSRDHRRAHDKRPRRRCLLLAPVPPVAPRWQARTSDDTGLRDLRADHYYLLRPGGLSPVVDDRPHFYVLTLGAASADAPASWPSWPGRVSATRLTPYHWARALHGRQAGSRLPLTTEDGRSQISGDLRGSERPRERPPAPSCPMCLSGLAYHRRDNLPGQIRA